MTTNDYDWRLQGQEHHLQGVTLVHSQGRETRPGWDHDHGEFCGAKFASEAIPDALHEGWTTLDRYRWICSTCFTDFFERFGWKVVEA
jgi:hypothetical protein